MRSAFASCRPSAAAASARRRRRSTTSASWPVNERNSSTSASSTPVSASTCCSSSCTVTSASSGRCGAGSPAQDSTSHPPSAARSMATDTQPNADRRPRIRPGSGSGSLRSVAPSCARVSACDCAAQRLRLAPRHATHQRADDGADDDEDDERDEVVALGDGERVDRRREVPVGEQERHDRSEERGEEPAERGDAHDEQQVEEEHAGEPEVRPHRGEHDREERQPEGGDDQRGDLAPTRDAGDRDVHPEPSGALLALLGRDHVDVEIARRAQHLRRDRAAEQIVPPRASARAEHELRRALGPRELHQPGRDVVGGQLLVAPADVDEQAPVLLEEARRPSPPARRSNARGHR